MYDPGGVRVGDRTRHLRAQICHTPEGYRAFIADDLPEIVTVDILHHQVERARLGATEIEYMDRVWMIETRRGLGFSVKTRDALRVLLDLLVQELDRHHLADLHVLCSVHGPHRALADSLHDAIAIRDDVAWPGK